MTVKVGNMHFGFGGFWYGLVRLAGNIASTIESQGEKSPVDLVRILKDGTINRDNPFIYWWYSRSAPLTGTITELATHHDFLGYPFETPAQYGEYILSKFEPMWMNQGINWMFPGLARDNEIPEGTAAKVATPVGQLFGLREFPDSSWTDFYNKAKEYIKRLPENELDPKQIEAFKAGTLGWQQLTEIQKNNLFSRYPELRDLYGTAQADSEVRNSDRWQRYQTRVDAERATYYGRLDELTKQLQAGEIDMKTYREKVGEAGQNYGAILDSIQNDPSYADIYHFFNSRDPAGSKYGFQDDIALGEYESKILYADDLTDSNGNFNWEERDKRIDDFITKWGRDTYDRIQKYLTDQKSSKGLSSVMIRKGQDSQKLSETYWKLPYKPISQMTADDEKQGNIPAEYYSQWKQYQVLQTKAEKEAFLQANPDLAKDWRVEYRQNNPEIDAMLALWGYSGKIQSKEAYDLAEKWAAELGIPFDTATLGVPPRTLIDYYLDYNKIVSQLSANSSEAKLYRLENPEWDTWGQQNLGWKALDDDPDKLRLRIDFENNWMTADGEYHKLPAAGYEQEWYLMDHPDYLKAATAYYGWKPKDFSKVPSREVYELYQQYEKLPTTGSERMNFRLAHHDLDTWLVKAKGFKPAK